jgi:hypothetical protein
MDTSERSLQRFSELPWYERMKAYFFMFGLFCLFIACECYDYLARKVRR